MSTLIDELEQAADLAREAADDARSLGDSPYVREFLELAARLRARVEHVRKMLAAPAVATQLLVATGPIPPSDETGGERG